MESYRAEFRAEVLAACDANEETRAVAVRFKVSDSWVRRIKQQRRDGVLPQDVIPILIKYSEHPIAMPYITQCNATSSNRGLVMNVKPRLTLEDLKRFEKREKDAFAAKRMRIVILAIEGRTAPASAMAVGLSRRVCQQWIYKCNAGGIDASRERQGRPSQRPLSTDEQQKLRSRLDKRPLLSDEVCTLRGRDIQRVLTNSKRAARWQQPTGSCTRWDTPACNASERSPSGVLRTYFKTPIWAATPTAFVGFQRRIFEDSPTSASLSVVRFAHFHSQSGFQNTFSENAGRGDDGKNSYRKPPRLTPFLDHGTAT